MNNGIEQPRRIRRGRAIARARCVAVAGRIRRLFPQGFIHAPIGSIVLRVGDNVFTDPNATHVTLKLTKDEAAAVVATDPRAEPAGYGLGRHGWVSLTLDDELNDDQWQELDEWIRTSYSLVAPKRLAKQISGDGSR